MIRLTRLNHIPLIVNSDLIEHIEVTPDTVVTLMSGQKFMVLESSEEIVERVIAFRKSIFGKDLFCPVSAFTKVVNQNSGVPVEQGGSPSHGK
jgi:flagellar protein FlbD